MILSAFLVVALTAVGVAWGLTADMSRIDMTAIKPIIETKIRPPRSLFSSTEAWHAHHCIDRGVHECMPIPITEIEPALLNSLVPITQRTRVDIAFDRIFSRLIGFRRFTQWRQADFACCLRDPQYRFGYALAENDDFVVTYEHSPIDNIVRLALSNKRHCISPPLLPLGVPTYVRPRSLAGWPDHLTMWLLTPETKMGYCAGNELPLWDESEESQKPHLSYPVPKVTSRFIVPFVKYSYTNDDMTLALDVLGLNSQSTKEITSEEGKIIYDVVKGIQAETIALLNGNVKLTISQLATKTKEITELTSLLVTDNSRLKKEISELQNSAEENYVKYTTDIEHLKHDILRLNRQINSAQIAKFMDMSIYARKSDFRIGDEVVQWPLILSDRTLVGSMRHEPLGDIIPAIRTVVEDYIVDFTQTSLAQIENDVEANGRSSIFYKRLVSVADAQENYVGPEGSCECSSQLVVDKLDEMSARVQVVKDDIAAMDFANVIDDIQSTIISSFSSLPAALYYALLKESVAGHRVTPSAKSVDQVKISGLARGPPLTIKQILDNNIQPELVQKILNHAVVLVPTPKGTYIRLADALLGDPERVTFADVLLETSEYYDHLFI